MDKPNSTPKLRPATPIKEPSPLTLPPVAVTPFNLSPLSATESSDKSNPILKRLFTQENINSRFESRCSSLYYFNNQAFGKPSVLDDVSAKIDKPEYPVFRRLHLDDLLQVLENTDCSNFRFVVLNIEGTQHMLFSMWAGQIAKGEALSHSLLACGKEQYSTCVAAGEIYFIKEGDKWCINRLSNQTGHFRSSIETLIAPLILLLEQTTFSFSNTITFDLVNGGGFSNEVDINLAHLNEYYDKCILNTPVTDEAIVQTESVVAQTSVVNDNSTATLLSRHNTPILVTTQSIFKASAKHYLDNRDEELEDDVTGNEFIPRARY